MGEYFQTIVDLQATKEQAEELGAWSWPGWSMAASSRRPARTSRVVGPCPRAAVCDGGGRALHRLRNNGMRIITGRTVFYSMGVDTITCPHCATAVAWEQLSDAVNEWYAGAAGTRHCGGCERVMGLNDWCWQPPWGFGYLGFEFWNWPPLTQEFLAEVAHRLGHRTVLAEGKL